MKWLIPCLIILAATMAMPIGQAQTPDSARVGVCLPPYPIVASANTGAGYINFCVYYPESVQPGEQFSVSSVLTAPTTVAPVFIAAGSAFTANFGCTEGTPVVGIPTTNGVVGTMWTAVTTFTLSAGSERCDFIASITMTVAVVPLQIYSSGIQSYVRTENVRVDNFNYLCDAPAIAPNAYSTTGTTCNDPNINLPDVSASITDFTDTLCRPVGNHGHCELDIHGGLDLAQDGNWVVDIADDTTNDGFLSVPPATISNISVNGTFPSEIDVNAHFPGDTENLGIDAWTTAFFWIAAVLFFSYMGWLIALAFAIPGLLASMVPSVKTMLDSVGLDFEALFILCLLGFILELVANRFQWGGYSSGARRLRFGA